MQIHKTHQTNRIEHPSEAVHIITSESTAGSLRVAIHGPKNVIGFPDAFSIGPLWKLDEKTGQDARKEWLFANINPGETADDYANKFRNALLQIDDIAQDVPIYLWFGDNAEEQTGLCFYLYLLREKKNEIFLLNTTQPYKKYFTEDDSASFHTGLLDAKILKRFFEEEKHMEALTEEQRVDYLEQWNALSETTDVLRIWKDGRIAAVPENHYDALILETVEKLQKEQRDNDYVLAARVVGDIVARMDEYIVYFFLEYRIRKLVDERALEIKGITKSMRDYGVKLG
ncbi:DUF1835 domain-containing protein [Planococcus sp. APC 3906]|uniref:DUF1835 domain-containing protein n=1 Tax=Planococcus sp. APC 3906 TaxID=3035194 RepID=UPI0025B6086E|nr:DUF1835 domain-containing protein [Planococcus sp. APC 3906]MDN3451546.1 DUF1835 domain-containing protein [Planococcus sp. APC 3906]